MGPSFLKETNNTKRVPNVSSARAAALIVKKWLNKYNYSLSLRNQIKVTASSPLNNVTFPRIKSESERLSL